MAGQHAAELAAVHQEKEEAEAQLLSLEESSAKLQKDLQLEIDAQKQEVRCFILRTLVFVCMRYLFDWNNDLTF